MPARREFPIREENWWRRFLGVGYFLREDYMEISIIIPTYNRAKLLVRNLKNIYAKKYPFSLETIVIDDGSAEDDLAEIRKSIRSLPGIELLSIPHQGPGAARNLGIRKAIGDVLVFINDDTVVDSDFLIKHYNFHKKNREFDVGLVGPFVESLSVVTTPLMKWLTDKSELHFDYDKAISGIAPWYYFWTCNASLKRSFLMNNKLYFDESFPGAAWEDVEFSYLF